MNFDYLRSAVREGLKQVSGRTQEVDQDLDLYEQLQPSDFKELVSVYGADPIMSYIRTMEARRMNRAANKG